MPTKLEIFNQKQLKTLPELRPGYTVKIWQKIKEGDKERLQSFEGLIISRKHGQGINATITVRKISHGVGVEKILPLHLPSLEKIEVLKKSKVRRAKLYYMRERFGKKARMKDQEILESPPKGKTTKNN